MKVGYVRMLPEFGEPEANADQAISIRTLPIWNG